MTIPGINIIPPSKRGSINRNVIKNLSSLSSIEKENEDKDLPKEFDLNKLMNEIKKEEMESDKNSSRREPSCTSLEDSLLDKSRISENAKQDKNKSSSENKLHTESDPILGHNKKKSSFFVDKPLIIIQENTNEFSESRKTPSKNTPSIKRKIIETPTSSLVKRKRTFPTLPLLSEKSSGSEKDEEFYRRRSMRLNPEKEKRSKC